MQNSLNNITKFIESSSNREDISRINAYNTMSGYVIEVAKIGSNGYLFVECFSKDPAEFWGVSFIDNCIKKDNLSGNYDFVCSQIVVLKIFIEEYIKNGELYRGID